MKYELVVMIKPQLTEDAAKKAVDSVKEVVNGLKGKVEKEDFWGKRKLAYQVKNMQEAYYSSFDFDLEGSNLKKLNSKLNLTPEVVRYLITNKES